MSSEILPIIKIVSTDKKTQGDFVEINEKDFDPKIHKKYEDEDEGKSAKAKKGKKAETEEEDI